MTAVTISKYAQRPLAVGKFARNDLPPTARFQQQLGELAGYNALCRAKVVFRSVGSLTIPASSASTRVRARFAWHSGPYASRLEVRFVMAQQNNGTATAPFGRLQVVNTAGEYIGDAFARFGASATAVDAPDYFGTRTSLLGKSDQLTLLSDNVPVYIEPDTDYFATISEHDYGRIQSVSVREISMTPDTDNGYAQAVTTGGIIYDTDRATPVTMARALYRQGGAHLWNWWADTDATAPVFSTATYTNIIDTTSTDVSSFRPGARLDLRSRARLKDGGQVPVVMKVYADGTNGVVRLLDSTGATIISASVTAGAGWYPVQGLLPNTIAKYDLHAAALTGTMTLYAVSIWQGDVASQAVAASPAYLRIRAFDAA